MKCPYCNDEMIYGFVHAARRIFFSQKKRLLFGFLEDEDIVISHNNLTFPACRAYHCPKCKKVIINYVSYSRVIEEEEI